MRIECHVIAGLGGPFFAAGTKRLDALMDALSPEWDATHWWHRQWEQVFDGILKRARTHKDKPVIILIGHSYGCLRAIQISRRLKTHGIGVDYIAAIDPTALPMGEPKMTVPSNVTYVDEFWSDKWFLNFPYAARWRDPSGAAGGKYVYVNNDPLHTVQIIDKGHVATASDPDVIRTIVNHVKEIAR